MGNFIKTNNQEDVTLKDPKRPESRDLKNSNQNIIFWWVLDPSNSKLKTPSSRDPPKNGPYIILIINESKLYNFYPKFNLLFRLYFLYSIYKKVNF